MTRGLRASLLVAAGLPSLWSQLSPGGTNIGLASNSARPVSGVAASGSPMLTGVVMMDDGSQVPGSVNIKVICNGSERTVARTSVTDEFAFQWTYPSQMGTTVSMGNLVSNLTSANSDASSGFHTGIQAQPDNCDLKAELPGYISSEINLTNPTAFDGPNVGVIWLRRIAENRENLVSILTLRAPKDARKYFERARDLLHSGKLAAAAESLQNAVRIYPEYADAWLGLGRIQLKLGASDAAGESLKRAVDLDPKIPGAWQSLGLAAFDQHRWADAVAYLNRGEQLDPSNSVTQWFYSAVAYFQLRKYAQAEKSIRMEIDMDPQFRNRRARYVFGLILIARQNVEQGEDVLRTYLATSPDSRDVDQVNRILAGLQTFAAR